MSGDSGAQTITTKLLTRRLLAGDKQSSKIRYEKPSRAEIPPSWKGKTTVSPAPTITSYCCARSSDGAYHLLDF